LCGRSNWASCERNEYVFAIHKLILDICFYPFFSVSMKGMHHHIESSTILKSGHDLLGMASGNYEQNGGHSKVQETPSPGVGVSTQALWAAANLQQTRQIGPSAVPMPVPEMILSASHWVQLLQLCKELEDCHQYWFAHKKESSWRLKQLKAKLEAEKMQQIEQKMEDVNASIATL
jgi:hypothetical protein